MNFTTGTQRVNNIDMVYWFFYAVTFLYLFSIFLCRHVETRSGESRNDESLLTLDTLILIYYLAYVYDLIRSVGLYWNIIMITMKRWYDAMQCDNMIVKLFTQSTITSQWILIFLCVGSTYGLLHRHFFCDTGYIYFSMDKGVNWNVSCFHFQL